MLQQGADDARIQGRLDDYIRQRRRYGFPLAAREKAHSKSNVNGRAEMNAKVERVKEKTKAWGTSVPWRLCLP